jgi:hypothetical protein
MSDDLYVRYQQYDNETLIVIIESEFDEYTLSAKEVADTVLAERYLLPEALHFIALKIWEQKISSNFRQYLKANVLPVSKFLTDAELRELFRKEYDNLLERRQTIAVDSTKYWFF